MWLTERSPQSGFSTNVSPHECDCEHARADPLNDANLSAPTPLANGPKPGGVGANNNQVHTNVIARPRARGSPQRCQFIGTNPPGKRPETRGGGANNMISKRTRNKNMHDMECESQESHLDLFLIQAIPNTNSLKLEIGLKLNKTLCVRL